MQEVLDRARLLLARGEVPEARSVLEALLVEHPGDPRVLLLLSSALLSAREGEEALALARRAVEADPSSAEAYNEVARTLHALGRNEEAVEAAHAARRLLPLARNAPQTAPVFLTLVWCLRDLRRYKEALSLAEEGLALVPDSILAGWASDVEEELAHAERERC